MEIEFYWIKDEEQLNKLTKILTTNMIKKATKYGLMKMDMNCLKTRMGCEDMIRSGIWQRAIGRLMNLMNKKVRKRLIIVLSGSSLMLES